MDRETNQEIGKADRSVMVNLLVFPLLSDFNINIVEKIQPTTSSTYILVRNDKGELYVQRRTLMKDYCPGKLDPFSGGVVQFQETYEANAYRELEEEMGIRGVTLHPVGVPFFYQDHQSAVWGALFEAQYDGPLTLQPEEVAEVKLMTIDEILNQFLCLLLLLLL